MRVTAQILSMTLMAGLAVSQTAPASQTVQPNPPQSPKANAKSTVNTGAKSPFAPKDKTARTTTPSTAKTQSATKTTTPVATKAVAQQPAKKPSGTAATTAPASAKSSAKPQVAAKPAAQPSRGPVNAKNSAASQKSQSAAKTGPSPAPQGKTATPAQTANVKSKQAPVVTAKQPVKNAAKPADVKKPSVQAKAVPKPETSAPAPEKKPEPAPVAQSEPANKLPNPGKRDPFLSPLAAAAARGVAANCTSGKRCLLVDQIVLKGIVQMKDGNMALVENGAKRPYVLHESDSLFNGVVVKITGDTMILREDSSDVLGRPVSREVIKKVSAPAV